MDHGAEWNNVWIAYHYVITELCLFCMQGLDSSDEQSFIDTLSEVLAVPSC